MIRRKHDGRVKNHWPVGIEFIGKGDQVDVRCICGYEERLATWFSEDRELAGKRPSGAYESLLLAAAHFLNARLQSLGLSEEEIKQYFHTFPERNEHGE